MTQTTQWTWRDQVWRIIQLALVLIFFGIATWFTWQSQAISEWFVRTMNDSFAIPESSQLTLSVIGIVLAVMGMIISAMIAIVIINMRVNRRFRKRLRRAFMLLIFLGWLAFLFFLIAIFLLGETDATEFFGGISSGLSTEIAGVFLTVLLLDTLGRSWEEWDEESIGILEGENPQVTPLSELRQQLQQRKDDYLQSAQNAHKVSNSFWSRLTSRDTMPVSYYEGAIAAIDSVLSDLPMEESQ